MMFYILNAALILTGCFVFYKLLLQKETFFPLNRFVLLGCLALSFGLPLVPVPAGWSMRAQPQMAATVVTTTAKDATPIVAQKKALPATTAIESKTAEFFSNLPLQKVLFWGYWIGVIIFAANFLVQLALLLYRARSQPFIQDGRYKIIEMSGDQAPCSFGNYIFINPEKYEWETYSQILLHEKIHIQQGHSYDILIAEIALIFQWFNPVAWMYRKAMEDNLEFLTDNELVEHRDVERSSYQMSLVKVSAPHLPLSLTTNYNQSILKKRLIMMNAKKSNIGTTWKYLFILPLLMLFMSLLNEPSAFAKDAPRGEVVFEKISFEGYWFATIKADKITMRFENDEDDKNQNSTTFLLSEFSALPQDKSGDFSLEREAGRMAFNGKFDGTIGMGKYKFIPNEKFTSYLKEEGVDSKNERDLLVYFMVNLTKSYISALKKEGFNDLKKDDLVPLAALKVDLDFIKSIKRAGFEKVSLQDLIPLKALNVDAHYIKEIQQSGAKDLSLDRIVALKAQGITGDFLKEAKDAKEAEKEHKRAKRSLDYGNNYEKGDKGSKKTSDDDMEDLGVLLAKKVLNVTADYMKGFKEMGYDFDESEYLGLKTLGVTTDFVKEIESIGWGKPTSENIAAFKAMGISPAKVKAYRAIGFPNITEDDFAAAWALGVTPEYIQDMRKKGKNYSTVQKYVELKALTMGLNILK